MLIVTIHYSQFAPITAKLLASGTDNDYLFKTMAFNSEAHYW